jgi:thymidylate kinase
VLLDLPYEEAQLRQNRRVQNSTAELDRMESESRDFHERVRASFLEQARQQSEGWLVLSALQAPEILLKQLLSDMKERKLWPFLSQP